MSDEPEQRDGQSGRDDRGRFARGNPGGPGNPNAKKVAELREAMLRSVTPEDIREVVDAGGHPSS